MKYRIAPAVSAIALTLAACGTVGTTASAATAVRTPEPVAGVPTSHLGALELNAGASAIKAWPAGYGGASCQDADLTHGTYSVQTVRDPAYGAQRVLSMRITGAVENCAHRTSPGYYNHGTVEVRFETECQNGLIPDWPAVWLLGQTWPVDGELDAFEGQHGRDYTSYWWGSTPGSLPVTGYTTGGSWSAQGYTATGMAARSAPAGCGWNTVDIVWAPGTASVYNNGRLFATIPHTLDDPMQVVLDDTEGPTGRQPAQATSLDAEYVRVWAYR